MKLAISLAAALVLFSDVDADAARPRRSKGRQVNFDELFEKADAQMAMYQVDDLEETLDDIEDRLDRSGNESAEQRLAEYQKRLVALRNMLGRVENIVIVDSLSVPKDQLLQHYRLSPDAGVLAADADGLTSHTPASGREVFFTANSDSTGTTVIRHAGILDDGTRDDDVVVNFELPAGATQGYPFMLSDGSTLYFAAEGDIENALGGLDIYMTRRDETGAFFSPTNVGMPYNSPYNDYMMAIDDAAGLGWWATDRNAPDGMVTVYIFKPNETRVNYEPDREDISELAYISSFRDTQPEGFDAAKALSVLDSFTSSGGAPKQSMRLSLGNGRIYTSESQFRNDQARRMYAKYTADSAQLADVENQLSHLRSDYASGNIALRAQILGLEDKVRQLRRTCRQTLNTVVRLETGVSH